MKPKRKDFGEMEIREILWNMKDRRKVRFCEDVSGELKERLGVGFKGSESLR